MPDFDQQPVGYTEYEIEEANLGTPACDNLLAAAWEPFAAYKDGGNTKIVFRRAVREFWRFPP